MTLPTVVTVVNDGTVTLGCPGCDGELIVTDEVPRTWKELYINEDGAERLHRLR